MSNLFSLINPWVVVVMLVLLIATGFGGAKLGADHVRAADAKLVAATAKSYDAGQTAAAQDIAAHIPQYADLRQAFHDEIASNPVLNSCHNPLGVLQLIDAAGHDRAVPAGRGVLPAAGPAPSK